jgi:hypothetical protein
MLICTNQVRFTLLQHAGVEAFSHGAILGCVYIVCVCVCMRRQMCVLVCCFLPCSHIGLSLLHMVCVSVALCVSFLIHPCILFLVLGLVVCRQGGQADIAFIWLWTNSYRYGTYFNSQRSASFSSCAA